MYDVHKQALSKTTGVEVIETSAFIHISNM